MNQRKQTQPDLISLTSITPKTEEGIDEMRIIPLKRSLDAQQAKLWAKTFALFKYMISSPKFNRRRAPLISVRIHKIDQ